MKFLAEITVNLKDGVRDVQGSAIDTVLRRTKIEDNANVKVGKFFKFFVEGEGENIARAKLNTICSEVLSNPILEKYNVEKFEKIDEVL